MLLSRVATLSFIAFTMLLLFTSAGFVSAQTLTSGELRVNGTDAGNLIRFSIDGGDVVLVSDGNESRFALAQVDELSVFTFDGDDRVINDTSIPMFVSAGLGDDYVVGGSGDDTVLGLDGDDRLFGRDGHDNLHGGSDTDYLSGGNGDDTLRSAVDDSVMIGGNGNDHLENGGDMQGGFGDDVIISQTRDACFSGGPGNDVLIYSGTATNLARVNLKFLGGGGDDDITAGRLLSSFGLVEIDGGLGVDVINGRLDEFGIVLRNNGELLITGTGQDDSISVTLENGQIVARVRNIIRDIEQIYSPSDVSSIEMRGKGGDDVLVNSTDIVARFHGDAGDDTLSNSGDGQAYLFGGNGSDLYMTNTDLDVCEEELDFEFDRGTVGSDVYLLHGGRVENIVFNAPEDYMFTVFGSERDEEVIFESSRCDPFFCPDFDISTNVSQIDLGPGDDVFEGYRNQNIAVAVRGGSGNDILIGGEANDRLFGDAGDDELSGGEGDDLLFGGIGQDMLSGGLGNDVLRGQGGDDFLHGSSGDDVMFGGSGDDDLFAHDGNDVLRGEGGNDILNAGNGDDRLFGGPGNDDLIGGPGNDRLNGEAGVDTLNGGGGTNVLIQ